MLQKPKPKQKTLAGKLFRSSMMGVRRVHLYSGIFMFPFVLLYGFTGWFFNHPGILSGDQKTSIAASDLQAAGLGALPTAAEIAAAVVEEMNVESFVVGGPDIKLSETRTPRYTGDLTFTVSTENQSHDVRINPNTGDGTVRTTLVEPPSESSGDSNVSEEVKINPIADITGVDLAETPLDQVQAAVPGALAKVGLESNQANRGRRAPSLVFSVDAEGVPLVVSYNLGNGAVSSMRADDKPEIGKKRFLERLHLARRYTPQWDVRWVWALLVDAMFVSMVFWGCSGLFMWWQVKRTRVLGAGVLVASVIFTAFLAAGMHDDLTTSTRGGNRGGPAASP